jgi:hypothetical protein
MSPSEREKSETNSILGVGSRLASGPAAELVQTAFARELADQLALFRGMSIADMAHTLVLIEGGTIPLADGAALLSIPLISIPPQNREIFIRTVKHGWRLGQPLLDGSERGALVVNRRLLVTVSQCDHTYWNLSAH